MKKMIQRLSTAADVGFTLIELLIVIVILGILAAIVVFSVSNVTDNGSKSACQTTQQTGDSALEAYYAQNQSAAATFGVMVPLYLHPNSVFTTATGASTSKDSTGHYYEIVGNSGAGDVEVSTDGKTFGSTC